MRSKLPAPSGAFVTVNGAKLHYIQFGTGPDLVLLHGASGNLRDWTFGPMAELSKRYRVTAFDRPGLGHSDDIQDVTDVEVQARHLIAGARQLGITQPRILGHSYGGAIALGWALAEPQSVSGLILLSSPSQVWPGGLGWQYDLATTPVLGWISARVIPLVASTKLIHSTLTAIFEPQTVPEGYIAHIQPELTLQPDVILSNARQVAALKEHIRQMIPRYKSLQMPVEILHGTVDDVVPLSIHSNILIDQIENARLTRLDGIGHMPQHVAWDAVDAAIRDMETRIEGRQ